MWTIDRIEGMKAPRKSEQDIRDEFEIVLKKEFPHPNDSPSPTGAETETSGDSETERAGWKNCPDCQWWMPETDLLLACPDHKRSSPPSTPTPPTQPGVPVERGTYLEKVPTAARIALITKKLTENMQKRIYGEMYLDSSSNAPPITPDMFPTFSGLCETEDLQTGASPEISSQPSTTTTSTPSSEMIPGFTLSENPIPTRWAGGVGPTIRACGCKTTDYLYYTRTYYTRTLDIEIAYEFCADVMCNFLPEYEWLSKEKDEWSEIDND